MITDDFTSLSFVALLVGAASACLALAGFAVFTVWRVSVELRHLRDLKRRLKSRPSYRATLPDGRPVHERL